MTLLSYSWAGALQFPDKRYKSGYKGFRNKFGEIYKLSLNSLCLVCNFSPSLYCARSPQIHNLSSLIFSKNKFPISYRHWDKKTWLPMVKRESRGEGGSHSFLHNLSQPILDFQPCLWHLPFTLKFSISWKQ